jgi:hypothetical protein
MRFFCDDKIIMKGALLYEEIAVYRQANSLCPDNPDLLYHSIKTQ